MRQRLTVHVRLPCNSEAHFATDIPLLELVRGRVFSVDAIEGCLIVKSGPGVVDVAHQRLVENIPLRRLDPHCPDKHEMGDIARSECGHFGSDPAAETQSEQDRARDLQLCQQRLINDGDVAHRTHPLGTPRFAEAGIVRQQHLEARGKRLVDRQLVGRARVVMQQQQRASFARSLQVQLRARDLMRALPPRACACHAVRSPILDS